MKKDKGVLVIGSGVGGLKASLEIAERGTKVYLIDKSPFFGGEIMQLERQFPTNRCSLCQMLPRTEEGEYCLRRDFYHPLIELISGAEITKLEGKEGNFKAFIRKKARGVKEDICTGCKKCVDVCPEETADDFNCFGNRKAISFRNPQPIPPIPAIDWNACTKCEKCVKVCPTDAINLKMKDKVLELNVSSVILAPGFDEFDPKVLTQYGYKRWNNVITSIEWERIMSPSNTAVNGFKRPSDGKALKKIAFLLCIGSRERKWDFCSSACCMYAVKEALLAKELQEDLDITIFYMDLRAFGKGYEKYVEQAKEKGIKFVRGRTPRLQDDPETKNLILSKLENGKVIKEEFDLAVLSIGQRPSCGSKELLKAVGAESNEWGFCKTIDPAGVKTTKPGVYVCGSFSEPKDIPDTITQATACAMKTVDKKKKKESVKEIKANDEEPKIGVLLCGCYGEISDGLDFEELKKAINDRPSVTSVEKVDALCIKDKVKGLLSKKHFNRLLVCACSPYWFRRRFLENVKGIDNFLIDWVNIREGAVCAHGQGVQEKAEEMIFMAIERLRRKEILASNILPVKNSALIIGGGLAGLTTASALMERGVEIHLVEKEAELGGILKRMPDKSELLESYVGSVKNDLAHVYLNSEVTALKGQAGDFQALIKGTEGEHEVRFGALILATGAEDYSPKEFLYGKNEKVIVQRDLKNRIESGDIKPNDLNSVVMIQCVGSKDKEHTWCSRFCCTEALENALMLKEKNPKLKIFILFKDMVSYGFRERLYSQAREKGVVFLRYEDIGEIKIQGKDQLEVTSPEAKIDCDILVLSTGVIPNKDNEKLAKLFNLELTEDNFFKEAEVKFRPVDALREGIYLCGGCHSPRSWQEVILQAEAAAERALVLLEQEKVIASSIVSCVNERRCSGCGLCVKTCPYGARVLDEDQKVAVVKEALCQGCGACTGCCPNSAATLRGYTEDQIIAMIETV